MRDVSCVLLSKSYRKDENGNILRGTNGREISDVTRIEVPIISEENVWKDEFYRANQIGLRPSIRLKLSSLAPTCLRCPFMNVSCPFHTSTSLDCYGKGWWIDGELLDIFRL